MANTIRIKRSVSTNTPTSLAQGELAYSETGSPNGEGELFIGTAGPSVTKITTTVTTGTDGVAAQPNSSLQDNQTITTGLGISGAEGGSTGDITLTFAPDELTDVTPVTGDKLVFEDISDGPGLPKTSPFSTTPLSIFSNDSGWEANQTITTGVGISGAEGGSTGNITIALDFSELTDMTGAISGTTELILQDGATESRKAASEIELRHFDNDLFATTATFAFDSTITSGDPGAGELRYNSATPASVTELYIDDLEENGNDWGWVLSNLAVNDIIIIKSIDDPADYMICQVDAATTDGTGFWTVPVNPLFTGALPTALDRLSIEVQWFSQGTAGTVTSVTAGTGLVNSGTASAVVLDFDFSELTDMTADISGTTEFILQDGTTESRKAASEIDVGTFDFTGLVDTAVESADFFVLTDNSASNVAIKRAFSNIEVGLFANVTTEYVSENDTPPAGFTGWNWVIDEDNMVSDSNIHVPTQQSVKAYVDSSVSSSLTYKGAFDPTFNSGQGNPDLDAITSSTGDTYTVTVAGTYNWTTGSAVLEVGDVLIAESDGVLNDVADWTIVQQNIGAASETVAGYIRIATQAETDAASLDTVAITPLKLHNTTFDGGTF